MRVAVALPALACLALAACEPPARAFPDAAVISCLVPRSLPLTPSTGTVNRGLPVAAVRVAGDVCELGTDESDPDVVFAVADVGLLFGGAGGSYGALPGGGWVIDESSFGSAPTTYILNLPLDTELRMVVRERSTDDRIALRFRLDDAPVTLTLLDLRRL